MRFLNLCVALAVAITACGGNSSPSGPSPSIPNFQGQYTGTYAVTNCLETTAFAGFCAATGLTPGTILPIALTLTQNQAALTGTLTLGTLNGSFTGTGTAANSFAGTAVMGSQSIQGVTVLTNVTAWLTTLTGNSLTGAFTVAFTVSGVPGGATLTATIVQLARP